MSVAANPEGRGLPETARDTEAEVDELAELTARSLLGRCYGICRRRSRWLDRIATDIRLDPVPRHTKPEIPIEYGQPTPPGARNRTAAPRRLWIEPNRCEALGIADGTAAPAPATSGVTLVELTKSRARFGRPDPEEPHDRAIGGREQSPALAHRGGVGGGGRGCRSYNGGVPGCCAVGDEEVTSATESRRAGELTMARFFGDSGGLGQDATEVVVVRSRTATVDEARCKRRSYLTADAVYSPLSGELVRGRDAVRRFAEVLANDRPCVLRFEPSTVSGSFGTCRWRMAGRTADGGTFAMEGVDLYEFRGNLIRVKDVYQEA